MPCNSEYLEPNHRERNGSKVVALMQELDSGELSELYGTGYVIKKIDKHQHRTYYNGNLDKDVNTLCDRLQQVDSIAEYSLEMQIWWRDHQAADAIRLQGELDDIEEAKEVEAALKKLTSYERELLGLDG